MEDSFIVSFRPVVSKSFAASLARDIFGLEVASEDAVVELVSYEDRNFCFSAVHETKVDSSTTGLRNSAISQSKRYVLKIMNIKLTISQDGILEATDDAMKHLQCLAEDGISCPLPLPSKNGALKTLVNIPARIDAISDEAFIRIKNRQKYKKSRDGICFEDATDADGNKVIILKHYVRLLSFVPGKSLSSVPITDQLFNDVGILVANVTSRFKSFHHPALNRKSGFWDIENLMMLRESQYLDAVNDSSLKRKIEAFFCRYEEFAQPVLSQLPKQTLHSDITMANVLVMNVEGKYKICGLVDFGDLSYSYRVLELASSMAVTAWEKDNSIRNCGLILAGFLSRSELQQHEYDMLFFLLMGKLVQCIVLGLYQENCLLDGNDYTTKLTRNAEGFFDELFQFVSREKDFINALQSILS